MFGRGVFIKNFTVWYTFALFVFVILSHKFWDDLESEIFTSTGNKHEKVSFNAIVSEMRKVRNEVRLYILSLPLAHAHTHTHQNKNVLYIFEFTS